MDPGKTFLECQPLIRKLAARQCAHYALSREDVEDFTQEVQLKLCADDYAVLRQFQERSTLATFLGVVISSKLHDYVDHLWGKWRPSAAAQEMGPVGVEMERLLVRDHLSFHEACQRLLTDQRIGKSEAELAGMAARLPQARLHWGRNRLDSGGDAAGHAAAERSAPANPLGGPAESAEGSVLRQERQPRRRQALTALAAAIQSLPAEDRLLLRLRFQSGLTVAEVARSLRREQKPLYPRLERILKRLRHHLQRCGIDAADIRDILRDADS
jgi:RNA polymerase sigma factor (sigma-70 family)